MTQTQILRDWDGQERIILDLLIRQNEAKAKLITLMQRIHAESQGKEADFDCMPENVDRLDTASSSAEIMGGTHSTPLLSCYSSRYFFVDPFCHDHEQKLTPPKKPCCRLPRLEARDARVDWAVPRVREGLSSLFFVYTIRMWKVRKA